MNLKFIILTATAFLLAAIYASGVLSTKEPNYVVRPDSSDVAALHAQLLERNGELGEILGGLVAQTRPAIDMPDGISAVPLEEISVPIDITRVATSAINTNAEHIHPFYREHYDRYVMFVPANQTPFFLLVQKGVEEKRIRRVTEIIEFFLTDAPGSTYGANKTEVANRIGINGGVMLLLTGAHRDSSNLPNRYLPGQELYEDETPVPGERRYMVGDPSHRDAAFEEIFHWVHDYGIGATSDGALEDYQQEIMATTYRNIDDGIVVRSRLSESEIAEEQSLGGGSVSNEYIATVIDAYFGLWDSLDLDWDATNSNWDLWGGYAARNRAEVAQLDPRGLELVEKFLAKHISRPFTLDPAFSGIFDMNEGDDLYTRRSQYLTHIRLPASTNSEIIGNTRDNIFFVDRGDTVIDAGMGTDIVFFNAPIENFEFNPTADGIQLSGPGTHHLIDVEYLIFLNASVKLEIDE